MGRGDGSSMASWMRLDAMQRYTKYGFVLNLQDCGLGAEESIVVARLIRYRCDSSQPQNRHIYGARSGRNGECGHTPPLRTLRYQWNPITRTVSGGHTRVGAYALLRSILYSSLPSQHAFSRNPTYTSPHLSFPAIRPPHSRDDHMNESSGVECVDLSACGISKCFDRPVFVDHMSKGFTVFQRIHKRVLVSEKGAGFDPSTSASVEDQATHNSFAECESESCILVRKDRAAFLDACQTAKWDIPRHFHSAVPIPE